MYEVYGGKLVLCMTCHDGTYSATSSHLHIPKAFAVLIPYSYLQILIDSFFLLVKMHPALNYRQSRRSACDRCRGFKLRCERDHLNGRSCERCLKAQVVCTTSVNHPSSNYLSSKNGHCSYPGDTDTRFMSSERNSVPILHKSFNSKVKKAVSSGSFHKSDHQRYNNWQYPETFSPWNNENHSPFSGDMGFQALNYPEASFQFDHWNEQQLSWDTGVYPMVSTCRHL